MERALICRSLGWKLMPDDLDELGLSLKHATQSLMIFEAFRQYAEDLKGMSTSQQEVVESVEKMRSSIEPNGD